MPRSIGLVTSLGAAALHDVATALRRRVPHIPVILAHASVQGAGAPAELVVALEQLINRADDVDGAGTPLDVILLVRGGGSLEDLWAFNDERLALTISRSPVPVVSGVGHETDFTIADFVADVRAPTPTAAAELVATPAAVCLSAAQVLQDRLSSAAWRLLDTEAQRLDRVGTRAGRPSSLMAGHAMRLQALSHQLQGATKMRLRTLGVIQQARAAQWPGLIQRGLAAQADRLQRAELRLGLLDPSLVLQRGYAWLTDANGVALTRAHDVQAGQALQATLSDGTVDLSVQAVSLN